MSLSRKQVYYIQLEMESGLVTPVGVVNREAVSGYSHPKEGSCDRQFLYTLVLDKCESFEHL